jgi:hypothetical protein
MIREYALGKQENRDSPHISHPLYVDFQSDDPEQFRAIGWVKGQPFSVIYEIREDEEGEYYHLVTLWKSTRQEEILYEEHSW